ncbi:MAG: TonB-dependent receptor [Holophagaceae bacterium]|nr:TonB-dependent receptor [Holophagaceae bacterium]
MSRLSWVLALPWLLGAAPAASPASAAAAAVSAGGLTGTVKDDKRRPIKGASLLIENKVSGYRQSAKTDAEGRFAFYNIPFNEYHLETRAPGMAPQHRNLEVHTKLPQKLDLVLLEGQMTVVVEDKSSLVEDHAASHLHVDQSLIDKIPAASQSRAMESVLLATPGFIADENGRFHFKGSHGQVTYVIDGVPVSDQVGASSSNGLDASHIENMEVVTGGISAEFGGKPAAVVNMTTKTGLGQPGLAGDAAFGLSRFSAREASLSLRGGTDAFGYFVAGSVSASERFLDPVSFENLHNQGTAQRLFTRFDWLLSAKDTLRFSISGGHSDRDVVNLPSQQLRGQDQRAASRDANFSLTWAHLIDDSRSLETTLFSRHATSELRPTAELSPGFGAGGADFPIWIHQRRSLDNLGIQAAYTQKIGETTLKAGLSHITYPIHENFRFAIRDPDQVTDPADPLFPFTPAGGGNIFTFDDKVTPAFSSAYAQSEWHTGPWFLTAGLRLDRYTQRNFASTALQPRLGLSYRVEATSTVFRASYDRLMITPENENLALSLSQQARDLGALAGTPAVPLKPELQNSFTYGVEQQIGQVGRVSLEYWEKRSENAADNEQFFDTGIQFPIAAASGIFHGVNLRLDLVPAKGFSAYLSLGKTRALFVTPAVGGLLLDAPDEPGVRFLIDHDQKLAAQLGLRFERNDWYAQSLVRYDSGLVAKDPIEAAGNRDLEFGIPFVRYDDADGVWRVRPRTTWDLSLGGTFKLGGKAALQVSLDLLNAFDEKGLYNFLSTFGGTHVIPPRTLALHLKCRF